MGPLSPVRPLLGASALLLALALPAEAQQQASPRDSVHAVIGGATIHIDYGRPAKRGRDIFGGLVPWNEPWRTGANQPTTITTTQDLAFGTYTLPAGTYALYTLPTPTAWKLIIHAPVPRWGIPYPGEANDLTRLDMTVNELPTVVEQFTIKVEPQGNGGVLAVEWDRTRATIPFTVRR
jgi:hypothetical protein